MKDKESLNIGEITKRLDFIIYLLLKQKKQNDEKDITLRKRIEEINVFGLKDYEIARILGKSRSHVAKELTLIKKQKK